MFSKSSIKYIQSLQHKKFRDEYNVFVAEGPKVVTGLLSTGTFPVKGIYALQEWVDEMDESIRSLYHDKIEMITDFELEKIATYTTANKVVAVFEKRAPSQSVQVKNKFTLVLDDIQDPGNLGTIIRTADWFGIENIICSPNTVDMYNNKVVQSTMASLGNVNLVYCILPTWLKAQKNIKILAAYLTGISINEYNDLKEGIIIIGNESKGISEEILQLADEKVTIPRIGNAESLNAAVATGIILAKLVKAGEK
ncbi:MAG: RNA methyltransferase [Ferruginibacter sp.]